MGARREDLMRTLLRFLAVAAITILLPLAAGCAAGPRPLLPAAQHPASLAVPEPALPRVPDLTREDREVGLSRILGLDTRTPQHHGHHRPAPAAGGEPA